MKAEAYLTLSKDVIIDDVEDDYVMLLKIEFYKEMRELSDEKKMKVAQAVLDELAEEG